MASSDKDRKPFGSMPFSIPDVGNIDLGQVAPVFGVPKPRNGPDFIDTSSTGVQTSLRMFYETGIWWLIGFGIGGISGIKEGWTAAAYPNWRLRINGIMNGMSKSGSKSSNLFAIIAMSHTGLVWGCDYAHVDLMANTRLATPVISGSLLGGAYYGLTHGLKGSNILRGGVAMIAGGLLSCAYMVGRPLILDDVITGKKKPKY